MKRLITFGLAAALSAASFASFAAAPAAPPSPEARAKASIETRQGLYKLLASNAGFGPIGGMMRGNVPFDAALVAKNAERIKVLAGMIPELFTLDTRQFHSATKTGALEGIWMNQADFKAKADDLAKAADALATAAKTGDQSKTMAAAKDVGAACGACHKAYREQQQ